MHDGIGEVAATENIFDHSRNRRFHTPRLLSAAYEVSVVVFGFKAHKFEVVIYRANTYFILVLAKIHITSRIFSNRNSEWKSATNEFRIELLVFLLNLIGLWFYVTSTLYHYSRIQKRLLESRLFLKIVASLLFEWRGGILNRILLLSSRDSSGIKWTNRGEGIVDLARDANPFASAISRVFFLSWTQW